MAVVGYRRLLEFPTSIQLAGRPLQYAAWAPSSTSLVSYVTSRTTYSQYACAVCLSALPLLDELEL